MHIVPERPLVLSECEIVEGVLLRVCVLSDAVGSAGTWLGGLVVSCMLRCPHGDRERARGRKYCVSFPC